MRCAYARVYAFGVLKITCKQNRSRSVFHSVYNNQQAFNHNSLSRGFPGNPIKISSRDGRRQNLSWERRQIEAISLGLTKILRRYQQFIDVVAAYRSLNWAQKEA